jgi:alpha-L-rhamnosidase
MAFTAGRDTFEQSSWNAQWCWTTARLLRPWNTYAFFRRTIDLPDRPTSAVVRLSADARYTLLVNGRRVHQGPARSFPHLQSYDTLDLADFLTAGLNAICVIVHQFGIPTSQSLYRDATGFLLDGVVETHAGSFPLHTPDAWLCRPAAGWRQHVARISADLGFQEHFDADADPPDWTAPDFAATEQGGWKAPIVIAPAGGHPWVALHPRGAPLLGDEVVSFTKLLAEFTGENARGYKVAEDVYHLPLQETRKKAKPIFDSPDAMLRDDDHVTTLPPPPDGQFHLATFDLGQVRTGHIILDVEATGDEIIDILYLQDVDKNFAPLLTQSDNAPADRYRCRPGVQRWESFWPKGFQYAALIFRNVEQPLKIRQVAVRSVHAAVEWAATFETSEPRLDAIYRAGVETLRACTLDAYVDCPDVGQAQRWCEARLTARAATYATVEISLLERGILQVAQSQADDGSLHAHPPSDDPRARSLNSMLAWVGSLWEHYVHTGRNHLLRDCQPVLDRLLEFLARAFPPLQEDSKPTTGAWLNLLYLQALRQSASIYESLGMGAKSDPLLHKTTALAQSIEKIFWDPKSKSWKDTANDPISINALALLLKLRPDPDAALAKEAVQKPMTARRSKTAPSPAQAVYALEALIEADLRAEALEIIRTRWGAMIDRGATTLWQQWDGLSGSRASGASASPVYLLPQLVLGIKPILTGWKKVRIAPLVGSLEFARGAVPSPLGMVRVEWEKVGEDQLAVRVELPEGMEGEFIGPLGETRELDSGASEFHT